MPRLLSRLRSLSSRDGFGRRLATLGSGTILGQACLVVSAPLITRLFTPEQFGVLAVFGALVSMAAVVMALRYEFAVPALASDEEAFATTSLGMVAALLLALLLSLAIALAGVPLAVRLDLEVLTPFLWILPPLLLAAGWCNVLMHASIRRGTYHHNAKSTFLHFASQAASQLLFGVMALGTAGLIWGYAAGQFARLAYLALTLPSDERRRLQAVRPAAMWREARRHWRYPVFGATSGLMQSAAQMLPAILLASLYGTATAGLFALGQRMLGMPVRVLSEAASQVFLGTAGRLDGAGRYRLFRRTVWRFLALGILGALPILLAGPTLFAFVFGEPWRAAGAIMQILMPFYLMRFSVVPISQILNLTGRQHHHLLASLTITGALAASFALGWWLALDAYTTILLYSLGSSASFLLYLLLAWRAALAGVADPAPSPAPSIADPKERPPS